MKRWDIINAFIKKYNYQNYLEIGFDRGNNFRSISVSKKVAVDPAFACDYQMTSDDFFKQLDPNTKFDIIFIDGLHIEDQVSRDIDNALRHLEDNGTIVMHDCNPATEIRTLVPRQINKWNGTTYKAYIKLRMTRNDLEMYVVDTDHGCGILRRGKQNTIQLAEITYDTFDKNRNEFLNLITIDEFKKKIGV